MSDSPQNLPEEDTISLIDLLAVIVRYRRMIVGGTLAVFVVAALALYGLPRLGVDLLADETYRVERRMEINPVPSSVTQHVSLNVRPRLEGLASDPVVVARVYRNLDAPFIEGLDRLAEEGPESEFLAAVEENFIGERLTTNWNGDSSTLHFRLETPEAEPAQEFLGALVSELERGVRPYVEDRTARAIRSVESSLNHARAGFTQSLPRSTIGNDSETVITRDLQDAFADLSDLTLSLERLRDLEEQPGSLYEVVGDPVTVRIDERGSSRTMLVVITIAAAFLLVFVAFVRQYAANVSRDPEEMAKLKAAWEGRNPEE